MLVILSKRLDKGRLRLSRMIKQLLLRRNVASTVAAVMFATPAGSCAQMGQFRAKMDRYNLTMTIAKVVASAMKNVLVGQ